MDPHRDDTDLVAALLELRPTPSPSFVAELDASVEAGFPRRSASISSAFGRTLARLRATPPRRLLLPAGGVAVVAVVVATAVVAVTQNGGVTGAPGPGKTAPATRAPTAHIPAPSPAAPGSAELAEAASSAAGAHEATAGVEFDYAHRSGPYASHHNGRDVEHGGSITLADDASKVRSDAARVFEVVHATNGIVLHSAIRDGSSGEAGAEFELLIPTAKLGDAMASFAGIADVRARHESTQDITAPTVHAGEKLQDSAARVRGLLVQLANAATDSERAATEVELRAARDRAAALRSRLTALNRRANLSHVSLRIETGKAFAGEGSGGEWGIGDGFDAAGRILAIAAGVAIIGLAILLPLALIALIAWLGHRAYLRRARHAALERA